ncbi:MAG: GMC oxidoreductase [Planctomycetota bacterium]|jgi:choline dehydrogenase-like flavoprotein
MAEESKEYDAIVVGSGMTGSIAAMECCERGLDTLVLEAGPKAPENLFTRKKKERISLNIGLRLRALSARMYRLALANYLSEPLLDVMCSTRSSYSTALGKPFNWMRVRVVNGRGLFWARLALRHTEEELQAAKRDGIGPAWPVTIDDLLPFYEKAEEVMQVVGPKDVLDEHRSLTTSNGRAMRPVAGWVREHLAPEFAVYNIRRAEYPKGALSPMLERGLDTGRMTLRENAVAAKLSLTADGRRADGVEIVHRETKERTVVRGRVVLLAASALESIRILLNSSHEKHPDGAGNSSGLLGRGIMDHVHTKILARIPQLSALVDTDEWDPMNMDIFAKAGFYIPPFMSPGPDKGFARRYQIEGTASPRIVILAACGEMLPRDENRVTIHPSRTDEWGVPILHISVAWSENEQKMIRHQKEALRRIVAKLGGKESQLYTFLVAGLRRKPIPGGGIHEVGGARMGTSRDSSVTNPCGQLWDVPNVYVCDGALLPSMGYQNTTLTIMALSARSAAHAATALENGAL